MTKKKKETPINIDTIEDIAKEATREWAAKNVDLDEVEKWVFRTLDSQREKILFGLLGFRIDSWSRWTLETSSNGDIHRLKERIKDASEHWLDNVERKLGIPKIDRKFVSEMKVMFLRDYKYAIHRKIAQLAKDKAEKDAERYMEALGESVGILSTPINELKKSNML